MPSDALDARPVRAFVPGPGGSAQAELFRVRDSEPGAGHGLSVVRGPRGQWSYFLRADTMCQLYTVNSWRQFMRDPQSYFRHLFADRTDGGGP